MNPIKKIQYNCKKATLLIEKQQLTRLSVKERFELRIHLAGCSVCRLYEQQSVYITQLTRELFQSVEKDQIKLDDRYKQELQSLIDNEYKNKGDHQ